MKKIIMLLGILLFYSLNVTADVIAPICTCIQSPLDLNFTHFGQNVTISCNCSDATSFNYSSFFIAHELGHNGNYNWSIRAPDNAMADEERRACNRYNKTDFPELAQFYEYVTLPIVVNDIYRFGIHSLDSIKVTMTDYGSNYANFTFTTLFEHLIHSEWDLDRTELQSENKTDKYAEIYKDSITAKKFTHGSTLGNTTYVCHFNGADQDSIQSQEFYYCNKSLIDLNEADPHLKDYCNFIFSYTDFIAEYSVRNSSYMDKIQFTLNESGYFGNIKANEEYYILGRSDTSSQSKAYLWYWANGTNITGDGLGFNNINRSFYSTDNGDNWNAGEYSFDIVCRSAHEGKDTTGWLAWSCDNDSNCGNTSLTLDILGAFPNSAPIVNILTPIEETINKFENITFNAIDPDGDSMNYTGFLCDTDGLVLSTIFTQIDNKSFYWNTSQVADGTYKLNVTATDEHGLNGSQLTAYNFSIDNTPPVRIDVDSLNNTLFNLTVHPNYFQLNITTSYNAYCEHSTSDFNYTYGTTFTTGEGTTIHSYTQALTSNTAYIIYFMCSDLFFNYNVDNWTLHFNTTYIPPPTTTTTIPPYFDENTTIETLEIGHQIINVLGFELIKSKGEWRDKRLMIYVVILCFLSSILLIIIAIAITRRKKDRGR